METVEPEEESSMPSMNYQSVITGAIKRCLAVAFKLLALSTLITIVSLLFFSLYPTWYLDPRSPIHDSRQVANVVVGWGDNAIGEKGLLIGWSTIYDSGSGGPRDAVRSLTKASDMSHAFGVVLPWPTIFPRFGLIRLTSP
jgi:hypothetical protein